MSDGTTLDRGGTVTTLRHQLSLEADLNRVGAPLACLVRTTRLMPLVVSVIAIAFAFAVVQSVG